MPEWLWHPKLEIRRLPNEHDYKVFPCQCTTAYKLYKVLTYIVAIVWGITLVAMIIAFVMGIHWIEILSNSGLNPIEMILIVADLFCSFKALSTMQPYYAQLLFPIYVILDAFTILRRLAVLIFVREHEDDRKDAFSAALELVITVIGIVWSFYLLYTFYKYLRDVKLHEEQAKTPTIAGEAAAINEKEIV